MYKRQGVDGSSPSAGTTLHFRAAVSMVTLAKMVNALVCDTSYVRVRVPYVTPSSCGEIGRRAGFKIQFPPRECGFDSHREHHTGVAQVDRAFGYEPKGWGFESLHRYQDIPIESAEVV